MRIERNEKRTGLKKSCGLFCGDEAIKKGEDLLMEKIEKIRVLTSVRYCCIITLMLL